MLTVVKMRYLEMPDVRQLFTEHNLLLSTGPLGANLYWSGLTVDQVATFCEHACHVV